MTCQSAVIGAGNPLFGINASYCGGTTPGGMRLVTDDVVGIITPGWVRKIIKNVPAYPKPIVFCVETT
jgi:hypothetical protein